MPARRPASLEGRLGVKFAGKSRGGGSAIDWFDVLKWVLIVLAAGFIGQFGKRLADHLVSRGRDRRATTPSSPPAGPAREEAPADRGDFDSRSKTAAKIAKKAAKAEVKRNK